MSLRNLMYASALTALVGGCTPNIHASLKNPEIRQELKGKYRAKVDGIHVQYTVGKDVCTAVAVKMVPQGLAMVVIEDKGCDNKFEYYNMKSRQYWVDQGKDVTVMDDALKQIQEILVKPENKVSTGI